MSKYPPLPPEEAAQIEPSGRLIGQPIDFLQEHLAAVVPFMILDLERQGGITDWHIEAVQKRRHSRGLSHDEAILYADKKWTAQMVHELCEELAIMAFVPGGVRFGKLHFEQQTGQAPTDPFARLRIEDFSALRDAIEAEMQRPQEEHGQETTVF